MKHLEHRTKEVLVLLSRNSSLLYLLCLGASLVTQMVENPPTVKETLVPSLDWEDPLEKGMATHSRYCLENTTNR